MSLGREKPKTNKQLPAIAAAAVMTIVMGAAVLGLGGNALLNQDVAPVPVTSIVASDVTADMSIQQLQDLVSEYQVREQVYKEQLQQASQQIAQANVQLSQLQAFIKNPQPTAMIEATAVDPVIYSDYSASYDPQPAPAPNPTRAPEKHEDEHEDEHEGDDD